MTVLLEYLDLENIYTPSVVPSSDLQSGWLWIFNSLSWSYNGSGVIFTVGHYQYQYGYLLNGIYGEHHSNYDSVIISFPRIFYDTDIVSLESWFDITLYTFSSLLLLLLL